MYFSHDTRVQERESSLHLLSVAGSNFTVKASFITKEKLEPTHIAKPEQGSVPGGLFLLLDAGCAEL